MSSNQSDPCPTDPALPAIRADAGRDPTDPPLTDLSQYDWVPVLRKRRRDGWSPYKQRVFIEQLADTGSVTRAARHVEMSLTSAYKLRRSPGAEAFAAAWDAAIAEGARRLVDVAFERAFEGVDVPVFDRGGSRIGARTIYSDRLLMFLLRAHHPDRYRYAAHARRAADEPPPPAPAPPVAAAAIDALLPGPPPGHVEAMPAEKRDYAIEIADMCDGELPPWYQDRVEAYVPNRHLDALVEGAKREGRFPLPHETAASLRAEAGRDLPRRPPRKPRSGRQLP
jgi:hypothetical protein